MVTHDDKGDNAECLVLLCEGNTDSRWQKPFIRLCLKVREESQGKAVRLAFLNQAEPSLPVVAREAAADGFNNWSFCPCFCRWMKPRSRRFPGKS